MVEEAPVPSRSHKHEHPDNKLARHAKTMAGTCRPVQSFGQFLALLLKLSGFDCVAATPPRPPHQTFSRICQGRLRPPAGLPGLMSASRSFARKPCALAVLFSLLRSNTGRERLGELLRPSNAQHDRRIMGPVKFQERAVFGSSPPTCKARPVQLLTSFSLPERAGPP